MSRYYDHVRRGEMMIIDQQGVELGDRTDAIKEEGARRALEIEARDALLDVPQSKRVIIVENEFSIVVEVPFGESQRTLRDEPGLAR
jgi:hypothetical protein